MINKEENYPNADGWNLKQLWPTKKLKEENLYLYNIAINKYLSTTEVEVEDYGKMILFGGYSYLSLGNHPKILKSTNECMKQYGTGTDGVRLLAGTTSIHKKLEKKIASFKSTESAITYSSGYVANFTTISSLVGRHDTIISDQLNHASINDGCVFSRATIRRFRHNDMNHLEHRLKQNNKGNVLVIADAVFSMEGDIFNLPVASRLCKKYGALLMIDECHSTGVIGRTGKGIEEHFDLPSDSIDIKMGTLGKAIPSQGGYIASSEELCDILRHRSGGFIYSGANSPLNEAASLAAFEVIEEEPWRVEKLHENTTYAKNILEMANVPLVKSETAILPILCGDDWYAWRLAKHCLDNGIFILAVPYPVVPKGKAILRLSINTDHSKQQIDYLKDVIVDGMKKLNLREKENV
jgi:8-amino-7-oxononanoate synthase